MLDVVPSTERKENSKVKENSKGKTQPASVITASVTPPTIVSTWSLSKHSWSRSLVVSEFHDWSVVYSPLMFLSWPTMSLLIIFSVHHPFISQGWTGLLSSFHFGTDFCVSKFIFFFSWGHCKKISLVSSSLQDSYPSLSLFLSLGRFQQYHQPSKGSWIKELST